MKRVLEIKTVKNYFISNMKLNTDSIKNPIEIFVSQML